ncbi:hypothetical protein PP568_06725 [Mycobacteroides abscessus]|uniref:Uncharacterized protein n=1 Tax=Mycobacteroides abscessus subsp. abscessus TaxID=1185650 RepID=A0AB38D2C2_9MYCO|nr:hypothetical protein [Mycobacteroides abscessus]MBE5419548.1 hypothetical protein [Mycobacteroides abscessus]MBE5455753.1 hypothetical protein [Mycobacteroides abscessus]MBN7463091.1 hypothetical protein [Mycobacteroides abscessus subsp. abscessus]MBN7555232.1 hypothetical protein [Mycobacteroides abscessus subsp. abscessus]MDM2404624.1 hypothetical protein [Mycobacteroides abscessus]
MSAPITQVRIPFPADRPLMVRTVADLRPLLRGLVPPDATIFRADIGRDGILCHVALPEQLALTLAA